MSTLDLGRANITPKRPIVAGSYTTARYTYTAGHPVDDTGYVKIVFRYVGDFGSPQFDDPAAPNYCSIHTTGNCLIEPRWDPKGHTRPWGRALVMKITRGFLDSGHKIIVIFGDKSGGSEGWRVQSFCERTFEFKTFVDPIATYQFKELASSPVLRIVAGKPERAVCVAPSQSLVNQKFESHLKLEDKWGNPVRKPVKTAHRGFARSGIHRVTVRDSRTGLSATSNPIAVHEKEPAQHAYWADFHGQSEETIGTNSIDDYFTFARDYASVDIAGHQGNDFQVTDELWRTVNRTTKVFYTPGRFVTFPGYEWSGNTPLGGDRNVYFTSEGGKIYHSCTDLLPGDPASYNVASTATSLFKALRVQRQPSAFAFAHVGGRYADMGMHDPNVELAVEVHSAWGTFEWLVDDALRRGYRIGICANSDGHKGRPGASYPGASKFGSIGGLTCVLAPRLDRRSVIAALRARHFFATTGNRPVIDMQVVLADGRTAMMGDIIDTPAGAHHIHCRIAGTDAIESVQVRNGVDITETCRPHGLEKGACRLKIVWSGAEVRGRAREVPWHGELRVKGNTIRKVVPINFVNPGTPLLHHSRNRLAWRSITTGGSAGVILTLARPHSGSLRVTTCQRDIEFAVAETSATPRTWNCGGLAKQLAAYRLPAEQRAGKSHEFSFSSLLPTLRKGDNPIYIRVAQEDGHVAWTSPVYVVR